VGVNHYAQDARYAFREIEDDPLFEMRSQLTISGTFAAPKDRAGDRLEITVYGEDSPHSDIHWRLKDVRAVDKHDIPITRTYRGRTFDVYRAPKGMATLSKLRGERKWTMALFVSPSLLSDLLVLLGLRKPLFLGIHEQKINRDRWVQSVTLQTTDPTDE
jgi:hypothetical protein